MKNFIFYILLIAILFNMCLSFFPGSCYNDRCALVGDPLMCAKNGGSVNCNCFGAGPFFFSVEDCQQGRLARLEARVDALCQTGKCT